MNCLAGGEGCGFKVSNQQEPCTVGIDLAKNTLSLKSFAEINEYETTTKLPSNIKVGFVDAEGQGDRDTAYDARIACPILLAAKCVLFNWRDSLQKDRILDLLGVMCRAANSVSNSAETNSSSQAKQRLSRKDSSDSNMAIKPFGHLHIVFRDGNFDGDIVSMNCVFLLNSFFVLCSH
jgi:hypothetical protein